MASVVADGTPFGVGVTTFSLLPDSDWQDENTKAISPITNILFISIFIKVFIWAPVKLVHSNRAATIYAYFIVRK